MREESEVTCCWLSRRTRERMNRLVLYDNQWSNWNFVNLKIFKEFFIEIYDLFSNNKPYNTRQDVLALYPSIHLKLDVSNH